MKLFNNLSILLKVTLAIVCLGLITATITAGLSYKAASKALETETVNKLDGIVDGRTNELQGFLTRIENDLKVQASNPAVKDAVVEFSRAWQAVPGNQKAVLQNLYINQNPYPTGEKEKLDRASDRSDYSSVHGKYHPFFRTLLQENEYYDIFLFDTQGNLIYSVFKELDYATNLNSGEYAKSDLGNAFRAALQNQSNGALNFFDFKPYAPSYGAPASFISTALKNQNGEAIGVLAFQMPVGRLNTLMQKSRGLGDTGEAYIVGEDFLMRTDSRFSEESTILKTSVDTPFIRSALNGGGNVQTTLDYNNEMVFSGAKTLEFQGTKLLVVVQESFEAVTAPVRALKRNVFFLMAGSLIGLCLLGYLIARSISKPINDIEGAMVNLAGGDTKSTIPHAERKDEIGKMAHSLSQFQTELDHAAESNAVSLFKGSAFDGSSAPMMIIDNNKIITFMNESAKARLDKYGQDLKMASPRFDLNTVLGQNANDFPINPEHEHAVLSNPALLPYESEVAIGDLKFQINVTAINNSDGEYAGCVMQWDEVTEVLRNAGILSAIDFSQAMIEYSMDGKVITANDNFMQAFGYALAGIKGKKHSLFCDPSDANSQDYAEFWRKLQRGESFLGKVKRIDKSGNTLWLDASYIPIKDKEGKPVSVIEIATDITDTELASQKLQEENLASSKEQEIVVNALAVGLNKLSTGDLTHRISDEFSEDYLKLKLDFNSAINKLSETLGQIAGSTININTGAAEMSQASDDLSQRTENQAAALEETAAALDEVTATVQNSAKATDDVRQAAMDARTDAENGGQVVQETVSAMSEIKDSSEKISQIIGVIDEIAFQTNLLALNAGVEAARAGEAGRGFAVVASEVRALAQRSSDAAKDIKDLIIDSSESVEKGVILVDRAGTALDNIMTRVTNMNELITEIASSASEQSTTIVEVNRAVNEMDSVTQRNAAMVEESTAACRALSDESDTLSNLVNYFNLEVATAEPVLAYSSQNYRNAS